MSNSKNKAEIEFDILEKNVEGAIITPFRDEILELVNKFGNSGQSGGSAPLTASAISQAVENLCLQKPLYGITNADEEWMDRTRESSGEPYYQNMRLSSVFKEGEDGKPYYLDAIIFKGQNGSCFTSNGSVKLKNGDTIKSRQFIKDFPFKPKTFYIDVIETEWYKNKETGELIEKDGGGWWTSIVKDEKQLEEVDKYYEM